MGAENASKDPAGSGAIAGRLERVKERVASACARSGRDPSSVRIMAVSKMHGVERIEEAARAGLALFGENRVQEASGKHASFFSGHPELELHMIGRLQSNKAKEAVRIFSCVESVDSAELLALLSRRAEEAGKTLGIYLELHTAEDSKSGFPNEEELLAALDAMRDLPALRPLGLMTMAPLTSEEAPVRASFRRLAALGREWGRLHPDLGAPLLSMGMSNDFELAVEEGSGLLRLGTILFGEPDR